ncbi:hypothetical protein J1N35_000957 [Gossypium stocksii]|uniref:Reverse transcriptase Ty1/copia-type domain-containing protein n=1 Tax=Gossypium stocksii TaxID=47602 RepID=A0A9D3WHY4_9ROSI|nr:hypothetical protein J1N35_000957 [Gossypium stocksii]
MTPHTSNFSALFLTIANSEALVAFVIPGYVLMPFTNLNPDRPIVSLLATRLLRVPISALIRLSVAYILLVISKKHKTITWSFTEAEYCSVADTTVELRWPGYLLSKLGVIIPQQPVIYCDNVGAIHLYANPVFHSRMKPVALDYHFIHEQVQSGCLRVSHISTTNQLADALTQPLSH